MARHHLLALLLGTATIACGDAETSSEAGTEGGGDATPQVADDEPILPTPTGPCPDFVNGDLLFSPAGLPQRYVRIFMDEDAAATADGPFVFYWHGWNSSALLEPPYAMGEAQYWVQNAGGIIAAPHADPAAGMFPWFLTLGGDNEADLLLADEVLACAIEKVGIDKTHIHSMGMSAGGLQTAQMSYRRSNYLASVVTYSGGLLDADPPIQRETNKLPVMMFHGGVTDELFVSFQTLTEAYHQHLADNGHFGFVCNHGGGHTVPKQQGEQAGVTAFLNDHPFGTFDSPYSAGLPAGFPSYCSL